MQKDGDNWYFILGGQITTNVGLCKASVEIFKSIGNDDFILNSAPFEIRVRPRTVVDSDIKSESDTTALYVFAANKLASTDEFVDKVAQNTTLATNVASNSTLATNVAKDKTLINKVADNIYSYTDFVPSVEEEIKEDSIYFNRIVNAVIEKLQQQS